MGVNNNAKIIRRDLLVRISKILIKNQELSNLDRIPLEMRPKGGQHVRCCTYRDRAVLKYKIMGMLGYNEDMEEDELRTLESYYSDSKEKKNCSDSILHVVDEACRSCKKGDYVVTNMCQGCVGRPCLLNCPKDAVDFIGGQAKINHDKCVNCGICQKNCPYHAIIYTPIPCENTCPVGAIKKDVNGKEKIDLSKCTFCGKCMDVCPYGAIIEKSHLFDLIEETKKRQELIALVAPALSGQFKESMEKIKSSFLNLGFADMAEVAVGADITILNESNEFKEHIQENKSMTTSCCTAYVNLINKHAPELKISVSTALSPMEYIAQKIRAEKPQAKLVFVGPCLAKKDEAMQSKFVDYTLNFEEYGAWLIASGIEISDCEEALIFENTSVEAQAFASAGRVAAGVASQLKGFDFKTESIDNIDKTFLRKLKPLLKSKTPTLIEVMSCENGCVGGCSTLTPAKIAKRNMKLITKPIMT